MGAENQCTARVGGRTSAGKALLETTELTFRGTFRTRIRFADVTSVQARGGKLVVEYGAERAEFDLGPAAESWAEKIRKPKSVIEKLGITEGMRVMLVRVPDVEFAAALAARGATVLAKRKGARCDAVFVGVSSQTDLAAIASLRENIVADGAIWIIRPKASPDVPERDVRTSARAAGLVDVKVVAFSATHTADKFVVPRAKR